LSPGTPVLLEPVGRANVCRAGFAGRGMTLALHMAPLTLASDPDPRQGLGSH